MKSTRRFSDGLTKLLFTGSLLVLAVTEATAQEPTETAKKFQARTYSDAQGKTLPYWMMKPDRYDASRKYPLILSLHGAPGRGNDGHHISTSIEIYSLGEDAFQAKYPAFVVAPQCPINLDAWDGVPWWIVSPKLPAAMSEPARLIFEILEALKKEFPNVEPDRIYLVGGSMGGVGAFCLAARKPELFAAVVPLAGQGDSTTASTLAKLPLWAFAGSLDASVPVAGTRAMIRNIEKAGGKPKYTEIQGAAHDGAVFGQIKQNAELQAWLFAQKRGVVTRVWNPGSVRNARPHASAKNMISGPRCPCLSRTEGERTFFYGLSGKWMKGR